MTDRPTDPQTNRQTDTPAHGPTFTGLQHAPGPPLMSVVSGPFLAPSHLAPIPSLPSFLASFLGPFAFTAFEHTRNPPSLSVLSHNGVSAGCGCLTNVNARPMLSWPMASLPSGPVCALRLLWRNVTSPPTPLCWMQQKRAGLPKPPAAPVTRQRLRPQSARRAKRTETSAARRKARQSVPPSIVPPALQRTPLHRSNRIL